MKRPFVHLNLAVDADGRVAAQDGHAVSISCATDWRRVHLLRESYDAVAVGARTWLRDHPRLTVRSEVVGRPPGRQPARVIFSGSSACRLPALNGHPTYVVGARPPGDAGIHVATSGRELAPALARLAGHGVRSLLVEGGPTLLASFLEQDLFDRLTVYVAVRDAAAATKAARCALPAAPALQAEPCGRGMLLGCCRPGAGELGPERGPGWRSGEASEPLSEHLRYLDPDACGVPNGGARGERLALLGPVPLPVQLGGQTFRFAWHVFGRVAAGEAEPRGPLASSVLVYGELAASDAPLVRLHSGCHTGDLFGSMRCDCGPQLERALLEVVRAGAGAVVYLTEHEGRGIGLWAKARAYLLQDAGLDTYEANRRLGLPEDARSYTDAAVVLAAVLGRQRIALLSNNPLKLEALIGCGFEIAALRGLVAGHNAVNQRYLAAKARNGHRLNGLETPSPLPLPLPKSIGTGR